MSRIKSMFSNARGATAVEYGIIAAVIAVVAIGAFSAVGGKVNDAMTDVSTQMTQE